MMHQFIDVPVREPMVSASGLAGGLAASLALWAAFLAGTSALLS